MLSASHRQRGARTLLLVSRSARAGKRLIRRAYRCRGHGPRGVTSRRRVTTGCVAERSSPLTRSLLSQRTRSDSATFSHWALLSILRSRRRAAGVPGQAVDRRVGPAEGRRHVLRHDGLALLEVPAVTEQGE